MTSLCSFSGSLRYRSRTLLFAFFASLLLLPSIVSAQIVSNLWHIPGNTSDIPGGIPMRNPVRPTAGLSTTFYQGVWKNNGTNNQTGGTLYYRYGTNGAWMTNALTWFANTNQNQFWAATAAAPEASRVMQYYFKATFSNKSTTFLHQNGTTLTESAAQATPYSFVSSMVLTVTTPSTGTLNADYTTSKLYVNEINADSIPVTLALQTGATNAVEAEIWTNLNNRDRAALDADGDGIQDGIVPPAAPQEKPPGYVSGPYPADHYFQAIPMTPSGNGSFSLTLPANKTGAYRISARYRVSGDSVWRWYGDAGNRDHCVTIAPNLARDMRVYEINVFNVDATSPTFGERSTLESLTDFNRWNLSWVKKAGANMLWFQPIHPNGIDGREPSGGWDNPMSPPYDPGSPYAVKNFFEVNELMTSNYNGTNSLAANRAAAMSAFQNFVLAADAAGVGVMLDAPFNHTSHDTEVSSVGIQLLTAAGVNTSGWSATDEMRTREARFFSRNDGVNAYGGPASSAANIAIAPDRNDFGKWQDVFDVYFGRYATLVIGNPDADTSRNTVQNEDDWMNYDDLRGGPNSAGAVTRAVWQMFASYVPYWLEQTGLPAGTPLAEQTYKGIDGLRADFGQGMPPQFWEYCINVACSYKWSFVFMTESLDGGAVTYRSNRHFDVLNENIVFPWKTATTTSAHRQIFEDRRNAYGQGLVLLNNTSHDEEGFADPWQAFIRYAVGSTIDGAPMIMYGQEIGTGLQSGFDYFELNFGKWIPHFKRWNSMQPQWTAYGTNLYGMKHLVPAYNGASDAREVSPALRASNRWFINTPGGSPDANIFSIAKYETANASPAVSDVVLGFVNLDRNLPHSNTFAISSSLANLLGLTSGRQYNVRNIAAYLGINNEFNTRRDALLWPAAGRTREDIIANGVPVSLNAVPVSEGGWTTAPFEPLFLRIYDVTTPPPVSGTPSVSSNFTVDGTATISWTPVVDPGGVIPIYQVAIRDALGNVIQTITTTSSPLTIENLPEGGSYTFTVTSTNPNDQSKTGATSPASPAIVSLSAQGDQDGDGMNNAAELHAGTDPLNPSSILRPTLALAGSNIVITWNTVVGKTYTIQSRPSLVSNTWTNVATGLVEGQFTTPKTPTQNFYRIQVEP